MADIGSTMRETRIRNKIDITTVEEATKIRAKYLRALENEEWGVLPGPSYAKSFLRTYAEYLGLDAQMLVEEYRVRFESPEELELPAFTPEQPLRSRVRRARAPSRGAVIALLGVLFVALLLVLGLTADTDEQGDRPPGGATTGARADQPRSAARQQAGRRASGAGNGEDVARGAAGGKTVTLSVVAERDVWVCLVDAKGDLPIEGRIVAAGEREGPFKSSRFKVTLGNGGADLRINGRLRELSESAEPQGYSVGVKGARRLAESARPTCTPGEGH